MKIVDLIGPDEADRLETVRDLDVRASLAARVRTDIGLLALLEIDRMTRPDGAPKLFDGRQASADIVAGLVRTLLHAEKAMLETSFVRRASSPPFLVLLDSKARRVHSAILVATQAAIDLQCSVENLERRTS